MLVTSERYPGKYCTGPEAVAHIYPTTDILPQTSDTCIGVIFIPIFKEGIMKIKRGVNAVIYARYSPGSRQTDRSIEGQLEDCYAFAKRHGLNVIREYIDRRVSATDMKHRNAFRRMISDASSGEFQYVIVWKTDRFGRDRYEIIVNKHAIQVFGVQLLSATEEIPDGAAGIIMEGLLETLSEYYVVELNEKLHRGIITAVKKGYIPGGYAPYGYATVDKRYVVVEDEAAILRSIFLLLDSGLTAPQTCKILTDRGILNRKNLPFTPSAIYKFIRNRKYINDYYYDGIQVQTPAIIDRDLFERVNARFAENAHSPASYKAAERYLLSGKCFCSNCGGLMIGESGYGKGKKMYSYYKCSTKKRKKTCNTQNFRKDDLENLICSHTQQHILVDPVINLIADEAMKLQGEDTASQELNLLRKQLSDLRTSKKNIMKAIEAGIFTATTKDRLLELEAQEEALKGSIASHEIDKHELSRDQILFWLYSFKNGDIHDKQFQQELSSTFINSVYVDNAKAVIVYNYCDDNRSTISVNAVKSAFLRCSDTFTAVDQTGVENNVQS